MKDYRHGINLYRSCLSKRKYKTREIAQEFADKYTAEYNRPQFVYWCKYCGGYHPTCSKRYIREL